MAVLKKLEYFVSSTTENTTAEVIAKIKTELNRKQNLASNKTTGGEFKNLYFAGFFDPRTLEQYLIFSDETKTSGGLSADEFNLSSGGVSDERLAELIQNSPALANFVTMEQLEGILNADLVDISFINTLSASTTEP